MNKRQTIKTIIITFALCLITSIGIVMAASPSWSLSMATDVSTVYTKSSTNNVVTYSYTIKNNTADTEITNPTITGKNCWYQSGWKNYKAEYVLDSQIEVLLNNVNVTDQCTVTFDETYKNFTVKYNGSIVGKTDTLVVKNTIKLATSTATKFTTDIVLTGDNISKKSSGGKQVNFNNTDYASAVSVDKTEIIPLINDNEVIHTTELTMYNEIIENLVLTNSYTNIDITYLQNTTDCIEILHNDVNITDQFEITIDENQIITATYKNGTFTTAFGDIVKVNLKTIYKSDNYEEISKAYNNLTLTYGETTATITGSPAAILKSSLYTITTTNNLPYGYYARYTLLKADYLAIYNTTITRKAEFSFVNPVFYVYDTTETLNNILLDLEKIKVTCGGVDITECVTVERYKTNGLAVKINSEDLNGDIVITYQGKAPYTLKDFTYKLQFDSENISKDGVAHNVNGSANADFTQKTWKKSISSISVTQTGTLQKNDYTEYTCRASVNFSYDDAGEYVHSGSVSDRYMPATYKNTLYTKNVKVVINKNAKLDYEVKGVYFNGTDLTDKCTITETNTTITVITNDDVLIGGTTDIGLRSIPLYVDYGISLKDHATAITSTSAYKYSLSTTEVSGEYSTSTSPTPSYTSLLPTITYTAENTSVGYNNIARYTYTIDTTNCPTYITDGVVTLTNNYCNTIDNINVIKFTSEGNDEVITDQCEITINEGTTGNFVVKFNENLEEGCKYIITYDEYIPYYAASNKAFTVQGVFTATNIDDTDYTLSNSVSMTGFDPSTVNAGRSIDKKYISGGEVVNLVNKFKISKANSHIEDMSLKFSPYFTYFGMAELDLMHTNNQVIGKILLEHVEILLNGEDITDTCTITEDTSRGYAYGMIVTLSRDVVYGDELTIKYPFHLLKLADDSAGGSILRGNMIQDAQMITKITGSNKYNTDSYSAYTFEIVYPDLKSSISTDRESYINGEKETVSIDIEQTVKNGFARDIQGTINNSQGIVDKDSISIIYKQPIYENIEEEVTDPDTGEVTTVTKTIISSYTETDITENSVITVNGSNINIDSNQDLGKDELLTVTFKNKLNKNGTVTTSYEFRDNITELLDDLFVTNTTVTGSITRIVNPSANIKINKDIDVDMDNHKIVITNNVTNIEENTEGNEIVITEVIELKDTITVDIDSLVITNDGIDITDQCEIFYEDGEIEIIPNIPITTNELTYSYTINVDESVEEETIENTSKVDYYPEKTTEVTETIYYMEGRPEFGITKTANKKFFKKGDTVTYTVKVKNVGTGFVQGFNIKDTLTYDGEFNISDVKIEKNGDNITDNCEVTIENNVITLVSSEVISMTDTITMTYDVEF